MIWCTLKHRIIRYIVNKQEHKLIQKNYM